MTNLAISFKACYNVDIGPGLKSLGYNSSSLPLPDDGTRARHGRREAPVRSGVGSGGVPSPEEKQEAQLPLRNRASAMYFFLAKLLSIA